MAGFEVVVRPVIFPDIRPRARPSLPPQDDPEKGLAEISGNPASAVGLSYSWSVSASYSQPKETQRRVDVVRVRQEDSGGGGGGEARVAGRAGGGGSEDNFIDIEVANRITMEEPAGAGAKGSQTRNYYYQRQREDAANIEILERNVIRKAND